jgi:acetate kinase
MKILVINSGSSTIKYQLFDGAVEKVHAKGIVARIAEEGSSISHETPQAAFRLETPVPNYHRAFELLVEALLDPEHGAIQDISEVSAIGHRAVHGADLFIESTLITPEVITKMEECVPLAPLHNPPNRCRPRHISMLSHSSTTRSTRFASTASMAPRAATCRGGRPCCSAGHWRS